MAQVTTSGGRRGRRSIHLDMTPMVDLAFLLLTFFVLTMTLNTSKVMIVEMPDTGPGDPPPVKAERVITLLLGENNVVYYYHGDNFEKLQKTDYSVSGLHQVLLQKKKETDNAIVILKPTSKSRYKNLIDALDGIRMTKMEHYYITKETNEEKKMIAEVFARAK